ncbi:MAG TPA: FAD-binding oxidoreductase [Terriglobales bacterium]|nr:FAD-binding oxidoreductase [Terriglobales bacterium]
MSETQTRTHPAWTELEKLAGGEHIRPATPGDAIDGVQPAGVIAPGSAQEVAQVLKYCSSAGLAVVPRGGGTKLWFGNRPQKADFILSTERLNRVVEHAWGDMTATVEAGCTIGSFQQALKERGQRLAADPLWPERSTVGGLLATAQSGTLRIRYGAVRDLVLGVEMALPDGNLIKAGGKVVKNVAGYDLTKLAIGSFGTLGVITRTVFRLHPIPVASATYSATVASPAEANRMLLAILDSQLVYTGLQLRAEQGGKIAVDVRFEGIPESLQDQYQKLGRVAAGHGFTESSDELWTARQNLFVTAGDAVICKCSVLPARLGALCEAVFRQVESAGAGAALVAQGTGVAELRMDIARPQQQRQLIQSLRDEVGQLQGTMIVEQCPVSVKEGMDVWGPVNNGLPLMQAIKQKFDPARTMNPGRYVGAI